METQRKETAVSLAKGEFVSFIVPRQLVKDVKTALEKRGKSHATAKITAISTSGIDALATHEGKLLVPSGFRTGDGLSDNDGAAHFLREQNYPLKVEIINHVARPIPGTASASSASALEIAVRDWYVNHRSENPFLQHTNVDFLVRDLPKTYCIYGPLLLLPQHAFQMESWSNLMKSLDSDEIDTIFQVMSERMQVSNVATNAPIPLQNAPSEQEEATDSNILRSPTNLNPLYGDFGPVCWSGHPSADDFSAAFWAYTKQNGIMQFWAPRYTMFSRGNITEKTRVLEMPSVAAAIAQSPDTGCSAVDLYAGIGYFAFSYVAAGVKTVLCWDLNPWSIEGLRRGAVANKWDVQILYGDQLPQEGEGVELSEETKLVALVEDNEKALPRIAKLRDKLPPIRHVNCGLLPTSKGSYPTAAAVLDPELGGWVHVHENFAINEIGSKAEEVRSIFQELIRRLDQERGFTESEEIVTREIAIEHVQRVKSFAPGVFHCVVDIFIPPIRKSNV